MIRQAEQPLVEAVVEQVAVVRVRRCRTCGVVLGGIYGATPEGFCAAHGIEGHRIDNTAPAAPVDDEVAEAQALLGIGGRP